MIVSRFAPAPTGFLHLGHVVNAIYGWGLVRAAGGCVLLRIEDHDRQRSRPSYETALLEDLEWLGFVPDGQKTIEDLRSGRSKARQSDRAHFYREALNRLRAQGAVYACDCTRAEILAGGGTDSAGELRYPGTCRSKGLKEAEGLGIRVRLDPSVEEFDDGGHGRQEQRPDEQCGDLLVRDRLGNWTYQFAVVVDDLEQGVTFVVRGDDLLASTGRQIQLARLLGRGVPPRFYHHALIMKSDSQKLSKADGDTGVRDYRERGWSSAEVIGHAAFLAGLIEREAPLKAELVPTIPRLVADVRRLNL
ncbi:MAG: glutamate--tRNA ligase family protein [Vicinamibacterales bacterium]